MVRKAKRETLAHKVLLDLKAIKERSTRSSSNKSMTRLIARLTKSCQQSNKLRPNLKPKQELIESMNGINPIKIMSKLMKPDELQQKLNL